MQSFLKWTIFIFSIVIRTAYFFIRFCEAIHQKTYITKNVYSTDAKEDGYQYSISGFYLFSHLLLSSRTRTNSFRYRCCFKTGAKRFAGGGSQSAGQFPPADII